MSKKNVSYPEYTAIAVQLKKYLQAWLAAMNQNIQKPFLARLNSAEQALALAYLAGESRPVVVVTNDSVNQSIQFKERIVAWQAMFDSTHRWHVITGALTEQERQGIITTDLTNALHRLLFTAQQSSDAADHYILPVSLADTAIPDPLAYQNNVLRFTQDDQQSRQSILEQLTGKGYARHTTSIEPGTFRVQGEKIDVAHPIIDGYITLTLFGNRIEHIVRHVGTRSTSIPSITLPPMSFPQETTSWMSVMKNRRVLRPGHSAIHGACTIITDAIHPDSSFPFQTIKTPLDIAKPTYVLYENLDRIQSFIKNQSADVTLLRSPVGHYPLHLGGPTFNIISEAALLPKPNTASPLTRERALELIGRLTPGQPAVHSHHGIGIYEGLQRRTIEAQEHEYLVLRYTGGDAISVPVEYAHKITPYIGAGSPVIHRLGGPGWKRIRHQAQADAALFAKELLATARARQAVERSPYIIDTDLDDRLAGDVSYTLTPDQARTWQEVKSDLEQSVPMDRLVVGDVGFGKTEIAIRAALHAVRCGRQVAFLCPTTILAQQHTDTFQSRLSAYGVRIAMLSRATSAADEKQSLQDIQSGHVNIAIGTHALLAPRVAWKNLGLVMIDEEQRFGVKQKEVLKKVRATIDVLSLSATPIPRSLSMALSGLKALSVIATPPAGRQDVATIVARDSDEVLQKAIEAEMARNGQSYIVAPKISHLQPLYERLHALVPRARAMVAHGRLPVTTLTDIMHRFDQGEIDVLISSSIVEHGLDLPNANTMIVVPATYFGLADLYQLRGRIGRRERPGRAYFLYQKQRMSPLERQRLTALTQASRIASGWSVAQHDLEIRGAGNLLGREQSGTAHSVGVQLYLDMVEAAIEETRQPGRAGRVETEVNLPLTALLPAQYIADVDERTRWYQRLARTRTLADLESQTERLTTMYGPLPQAGANLILLLRLQIAAGAMNITHISYRNITPADEDPYMRLEVRSETLPDVLAKLQTLGNWAVKNTLATWDVDAITPELLERIIAGLMLS